MNNPDEIFPRALAAHRAGDLENATLLYREVLDTAPENIGALRNLATLHAMKGDIDEAVTLYRQVLRLAPEDLAVLTNLGQILLASGDRDEVRTLYNKALEIDSGQAAIRTSLADICLMAGDADEAARHYALITETGPAQGRIHANYATALNVLDRHTEALEQARIAVEFENDNAEAWNTLGRIELARGEPEEALSPLKKAAELKPDWFAPWLDLGISLQQLDRMPEALASFNEAWKLNPDDPETGKALASVCISSGQTEFADEILARLSTLFPQDGEIDFHRAISLRSQGKLEESVRLFRRAIEMGLNVPEVHNNLAVSLFDLNLLDETYTSARKSIELDPEFSSGYNTLGNWASETGDLGQSKSWYLKAAELEPKFAAAVSNAAYVTRLQGDLDEAIVLYQQALKIDPEMPEAWSGIGLSYQQDNRFEEALEAFDKGLSSQPDNWELLNNKAISLQAKGHINEALAVYKSALESKPDNPEIYYNLGNLLQTLKRTDESIAMFNAALKIKPDYNAVFSYLAHALMQQCNWVNLDSAIERIVQNIAEEVKTGKIITTSPFSMLSLPVPAEYRLLSARQLASQTASELEHQRKSVNFSYQPKGKKLKIGYVSPDFRRHSLGLTFLDLLMAHDHEDIEYYGYGIFSNDPDEVTDQFRRSFDHFRDLTALPHVEAASVINADGINILVDLAGYTRGSRLQIFSLLPAPVQVHYLGYGHTIGADYIPWLISDHAVIPTEIAEQCSEQLVYLPDSFLATSRHEMSQEIFTRADFGLPDDAFVLANFNGLYKIDPKAFGVWMRFMRKTPDAVLWLQSGTKGAEENLRREAEARGVSADRLVFAGVIPHTSHLARLHLADIALDAFYHSGGVTTTDAIWAGLPVLTVSGPTPSAQTGVSVLQAAELPEMITWSLEEYEKRLHQLSDNRQELIAIREKMIQSRDKVPLFNSQRLARHLELGYRMMWEQHEAGLPPESFDIPPLPQEG
jgi:protein O-GlcNAc transferase